MLTLSESDVRGSFVNCTQGEAKRLRLPTDLDDRPWAALDFLGWVDPRSPMQAYLVAPVEERLIGVQLRRNTAGVGTARARMCSVCLTTHARSGVSLMVAPRAGKAGREGNTVGLDLCAELQCSAYVRGLLPAPAMSAAHETLSTEERIARLQRNLRAFLDRVVSG